MKQVGAIVGIVAGVLLFQVGSAAAGPAKNGKAVIYAKVDTNDGTVLSFGGAKTTGATGSPIGSNTVDVTFTGKYPMDITPDQVIVQATCEFGNFCVANATVLAATPT